MGVQLVFDHSKRFELEMHIGRGEKSSNTECVFFLLYVLVERPKTVRETEEEKGSRAETDYNQLA